MRAHYTPAFQQTEAGCRLEGAERWELAVDGATVGLQAFRPRLLPWLRVVRVPRFGRNLDAARARRVVEAMAELARERPVLRLHLELWSEDAEERAGLAEACARAGLRRAVRPRVYNRTIWMDLSGNEEELLGSLHHTARRHIRAPEKKGYEVRHITDAAAVPVLERIFRETFARTGGSHPRLSWADVVRLSAGDKSDLQLVGLFRAADFGPCDPVSFAVGMLHGDVAEFAHAGSVRHPSLHLPLLYAPTWALMRWARGRGARWWDFGGVIRDSGTENDPRRGIADFKRYFSRDEREVGEEWVLQPRRFASLVAGLPDRMFR